jgi:hypothetical protein
MPAKKWVNWSIFKNPGPFCYRHFAKYGRPPDEEIVFFNKLNAYPIPRRLLPNIDKAIKVIEECDLAPLPEDQREWRETVVRNTIGEIAGWKRYEQARPTPASEKAYFSGRASDLRRAAAVLRDEEFSPELIKGVLERADSLQQLADSYIVHRHKPTPPRAKQFALESAWWMLTDFRDWRPGVTREGPWQRLSSILYDGSEQSIGIEYLQRSHEEICRKFEEARAEAGRAMSKID